MHLREIKWDNLRKSNDSNLAYNEFLGTFTALHNHYFSGVNIKVKVQNPLRTWITNNIAKSSTKKQKVYKKKFENRNPQNLARQKNKKMKEKLLLRKNSKLKR